MPNFADPRSRELNELNRRAQELLDKGDAVTTLFPADRQGWERKAAVVARSFGDDALARRCEIEAAGCRRADAPFGIPLSAASA